MHAWREEGRGGVEGNDELRRAQIAHLREALAGFAELRRAIEALAGRADFAEQIRVNERASERLAAHLAELERGI